MMSVLHQYLQVQLNIQMEDVDMFLQQLLMAIAKHMELELILEAEHSVLEPLLKVTQIIDTIQEKRFTQMECGMDLLIQHLDVEQLI